MGRGHFRCTVIGSTERVLAAPFWANLGYEKGDPIFLCIIAFILRSFSRLSKFTPSSPIPLSNLAYSWTRSQLTKAYIKNKLEETLER
jgi:hypothetical protein